MINNYEEAEIVEVGNARDVILGGPKGVAFDESPAQGFRHEEMADDE